MGRVYLEREKKSTHISLHSVDDVAIRPVRAARIEQRSAAPESPHGKAVGFQQEPQRAQNGGIIIDHIDGGER